MDLLTDDLRKALLNNGAVPDETDHQPVVKFFTPDGAATWLITEIYPDDQDILFGLCDLGLGFPELGTVSFSELGALRGRLGLPVERDLFFAAKHPLSVYVEAARVAGCIITETRQLEAAAQRLAAQKAGG
jgi:hypothetical protein